jgi:uncharacterized protein YggE
MFQEFRKLIISTVIILAAFFLYTKIAGPIPFFVNSIQTTKTDLFSTTGEAEETAVPDEATINVGVTQQALTVSDAQDKANTVADKLINEIKKLGIPEKDIKTVNYTVTPNYSGGVPQPLIEPGGGSREQKITSYTVDQSLQIKVKPIDKVNRVIDTATANGANLVGGVNFTFSDDLQKSLEKKARENAVKDAKEKAQGLANAAGVRLGKIVNVVEGGNSFVPLRAAASLEKASDQTQPTNVTPGENTLTVTVTLYYETF